MKRKNKEPPILGHQGGATALAVLSAMDMKHKHHDKSTPILCLVVCRALQYRELPSRSKDVGLGPISYERDEGRASKAPQHVLRNIL